MELDLPGHHGRLTRRQLLGGLLAGPAVLSLPVACSGAGVIARSPQPHAAHVPTTRPAPASGTPVNTPMTLVRGSYRIAGAAPDGDSVRFYPDDPRDWLRIGGGRPVRTNRLGGAQLRLDGIDALETHYTPPGGGLGVLHQPLGLGREAAARLLQFLGFEAVTRGPREVVTSARPSRCPGYIFTRQTDRYGRCVALAFAGPAPAGLPDQVPVDVTLLRASANHFMLRQGLAYPTFYSQLPALLREDLTAAVRAARADRSGVWPRDRTAAGFTVRALADLSTEAYLLPKLFRRLADYFAAQGESISLAGFGDNLAARDDRLTLVSDGSPSHLSRLVQIEGQTVRLTRPPEDLVFQEAE